MGMHFEGKAVVKAPVDKVWKFISTPESVAQCLPGVEEYKVLDGKRTEARVKMGVGFIKGTFKVNSRLLEEDPANHRAKLVIDGSGAASAFKAEIQINCNSHPEGSELAWVADATVSGPLGSVAKGLIENASQKVVNQTLECVTSKVTASS